MRPYSKEAAISTLSLTCKKKMRFLFTAEKDLKICVPTPVPLPCKASALPFELISLYKKILAKNQLMINVSYTSLNTKTRINLTLIGFKAEITKSEGKSIELYIPLNYRKSITLLSFTVKYQTMFKLIFLQKTHSQDIEHNDR